MAQTLTLVICPLEAAVQGDTGEPSNQSGSLMDLFIYLFIYGAAAAQTLVLGQLQSGPGALLTFRARLDQMKFEIL